MVKYTGVLFALSTLTTVACRTTQPQTSMKVADETVADTGCAGIEPQGDPAVWLRQYTSQADLERIFLCAKPSVPAGIPVGDGRGAGTVYNAWPVWNSLQAQIGQLIWGGKRFMRDGERTHLINFMVDTGTTRYKANVIVGKSVLDGKDTIILDYRADDSPRTLGPAQSPVQLLVDKIAPGIRDEIREIYQNGQPTRVFIGRAHIYRRALNPVNFTTGNLGFPINDTDFARKDKWFLAANFFLDFRPAH